MFPFILLISWWNFSLCLSYTVLSLRDEFKFGSGGNEFWVTFNIQYPHKAVQNSRCILGTATDTFLCIANDTFLCISKDTFLCVAKDAMSEWLKCFVASSSFKIKCSSLAHPFFMSNNEDEALYSVVKYVIILSGLTRFLCSSRDARSSDYFLDRYKSWVSSFRSSCYWRLNKPRNCLQKRPICQNFPLKALIHMMKQHVLCVLGV